MLALVLLFLFQSDDDAVRFQPISPGNVVSLGSFSFEIPPGVVFADEQNVHHLFKLTGADYVPNCAGMFVSSSNTWDYNIVIQYLPGQRFRLAPEMEGAQFLSVFARNHFYTLKPVEPGSQPALFWEPNYDRDQHAFSLGMSYLDFHSEPYVYVKKIWVTDQDALVFSLMSKEPAYLTDQEPIEAVFSSVRVAEGRAPAADDDAEAMSYLQLLGMQPSPVEPAAPAPSLTLSITLLVIGLGFLAFGLASRKRQKRARQAASEDAGGDPA